MSFDINTSEFIKLSAKLGKLHRSALPVAVRGTLNDAAFESKKLIPAIASRKFITRKKSFFRAFSIVDKARGFNVGTMKATVGVNPSKGSKIAEGLSKQEKGGNIESGKLIPHDKGRISGSHSKVIRKTHRLSSIKIARQGKKSSGKNYLLIKKGGKGTVFFIKNSGKKSKLVPVYSYRNTKISKVKPSPFVSVAAMEASKRIPAYYKIQAERQFKRALK
jgi:hypothetical protein